MGTVTGPARTGSRPGRITLTALTGREHAAALAGHEQALVLTDGMYFPALAGFFLALADGRPVDGMLVTINGWLYRASIRSQQGERP